MAHAERNDILVIGGGPAGAAAAAFAARGGARAALLEQTETPGASQSGGWIGPKGVALCEELGIKPASAIEFSQVILRSWDFKKHSIVNDAELGGWIVPRGDLDRALLDAARRAGATVKLGAAAQRLRLGEDCAAVSLADGSSETAEIVILADGLDSALALQAGLPAAGRLAQLPETVSQEFEAAAGEVALEFAIGAGRSAQLATLTRAHGRTRVTLSAHAVDVAVSVQFERMLEAARGAGVIRGAALAPAQRQRIGAGAALDLETHVAKRTLLAGDAGGFVSAFGNEGVYPAMLSGRIAAETALAALKARPLQDALPAYGDAWRMRLAEYLRLPNTDLAMLMPLVFGNAQMSKRVARALLLGQHF